MCKKDLLNNLKNIREFYLLYLLSIECFIILCCILVYIVLLFLKNKLIYYPYI